MTTRGHEAATVLHRFECPVRPVVVTRKVQGGPAHAVLAGTEGRCWLVSVDDALSGPLPWTPPPPFDLGVAYEIIDFCDVAGDRLLVIRCDSRDRDEFAVYDRRRGEAVFAAPDASGAALTPDGNDVLVLGDEGLALVDLQRPAAPSPASGPMPTGPAGHDGPGSDPDGLVQMFDNPNSLMTIASPGDPSTFTLAVGDYGFVVVAELSLGGAGARSLAVTAAPRLFSEGLVYDPVDIIDVVPGRSVIVRHGHGCGISRFDLRDGTETACPLPPAKPEPHYGAFRRAVASSTSEGVWVQTDAGPYFWDGEGGLGEVHADAGNLLALAGNDFLGVSADGRNLIRGPFRALPG